MVRQQLGCAGDSASSTAALAVELRQKGRLEGRVQLAELRGQQELTTQQRP